MLQSVEDEEHSLKSPQASKGFWAMMDNQQASGIVYFMQKSEPWEECHRLL